MENGDPKDLEDARTFSSFKPGAKSRIGRVHGTGCGEYRSRIGHSASSLVFSLVCAMNVGTAVPLLRTNCRLMF